MKRGIARVGTFLILITFLCASFAGAESAETGARETAAVGLATMSTEINERFARGAGIAVDFANAKDDRLYDFEIVNLEDYAYQFFSERDNRMVDLYASLLTMAGEYRTFGVCGILSQRLAKMMCDYTMSLELPFCACLDSNTAMRESVYDSNSILCSTLSSDYILVRDSVLKPCQDQGLKRIAIIKEDIFALETITDEMISASAEYGIEVVSVAEPVDLLENRAYYTNLWKAYDVQAVFVCVSEYSYFEKCLLDFLEQFPETRKYVFDFYFPEKLDGRPGYTGVSGTDYFDNEMLNEETQFRQTYREKYGEDPDTYARSGYACADTLCWYLNNLEMVKDLQ